MVEWLEGCQEADLQDGIIELQVTIAALLSTMVIMPTYSGV